MENQHKQTLMQEQWTKLQKLVQAYPKALQILPKAYLAQYQRLDQQLSSQEASPLQTEAEDKIRKKPFVEVMVDIINNMYSDIQSTKRMQQQLNNEDLLALKQIIVEEYVQKSLPIAKEIGTALLAGIEAAKSKNLAALAEQMSLKVGLIGQKSYLHQHYKKHKDFYKKQGVVVGESDGIAVIYVLDSSLFKQQIPTNVVSKFILDLKLDKLDKLDKKVDKVDEKVDKVDEKVEKGDNQLRQEILQSREQDNQNTAKLEQKLEEQSVANMKRDYEIQISNWVNDHFSGAIHSVSCQELNRERLLGALKQAFKADGNTEKMANHPAWVYALIAPEIRALASKDGKTIAAKDLIKLWPDLSKKIGDESSHKAKEFLSISPQQSFNWTAQAPSEDSLKQALKSACVVLPVAKQNPGSCNISFVITLRGKTQDTALASKDTSCAMTLNLPSTARLENGRDGARIWILAVKETKDKAAIKITGTGNYPVSILSFMPNFDNKSIEYSGKDTVEVQYTGGLELTLQVGQLQKEVQSKEFEVNPGEERGFNEKAAESFLGVIEMFSELVPDGPKQVLQSQIDKAKRKQVIQHTNYATTVLIPLKFTSTYRKSTKTVSVCASIENGTTRQGDYDVTIEFEGCMSIDMYVEE